MQAFGGTLVQDQACAELMPLVLGLLYHIQPIQSSLRARQGWKGSTGQVQTKQEPMAENLVIVGIGASAGGLEATSALLRSLATDLPCAYVLLQHLSPNHRSMLSEILARETTLVVREASSNEQLEKGHLYVIPSSSNAILLNGRIMLSPTSPEIVPKPSINVFFASLAEANHECAVGVLLSGTGTDGVDGLRSIQANGGVTLVQQPETARYDGMPRAAIEALVADFVLSPEEIAAQLRSLLAGSCVDGEIQSQKALEQILGRIKEVAKCDFSGYKTPTILRRLRRRQIATGQDSLVEYAAWSEEHPEEFEVLAREIMISVTAFFRDAHAFAALERTVQEICARHQPGEEIRVWVAGCATGEEAYSIAILFARALDEELPRYRIQIFATDIDENALAVARRGVYSQTSLKEIDAEIRERYFVERNGQYELSKQIRDLVVVARHNLVNDPPFHRLDLISCRNVLIYFDAVLQAKVLQAFAFGLKAGCTLFLGRSESVVQAEHYFAACDRRERLFRKAGTVAAKEILATQPLRIPSRSRIAEFKYKAIQAALVKHFQTTIVVCDINGTILQTQGDVERYLRLTEGGANLAVTELVIAELRSEVLAGLHQFQKEQQIQTRRRRRIGDEWVRLSIMPLEQEECQNILILFESLGAAETPETEEPVNSQIEEELLSTREHLQTVIEDLATVNEEMQALNEEAQASNEELQATNEELETANEELQASNQELLSLNEEMTARSAELAEINEEYMHLYDALPFPVLVFSSTLVLLRFNSAAAHAFDLWPTHRKQHIDRIHTESNFAPIRSLLEAATTRRERLETLWENKNRYIRLTVTPGCHPNGEIATLVVNLLDVTEITEAQQKLSVLATHDTLTGLPNRALFMDRLHQALAQSERSLHRVALLFIDLDNFKTINDTCGHAIGDMLLCETAHRLQHAIREEDTVARIGGDEFTVVLSNCDIGVVDRIARRIEHDLALPFDLQERKLFVTASVGIAFSPHDARDINDLIRCADSAMYRAKEQGRNRVEYFKPELQKNLLKRATMENSLREAIKQSSLQLVYQPKFALTGEDLRNSEMLGMEVLARWEDEELGNVPPAEFVALAETRGLIMSMTDQLLNLLFEQICIWKSQGCSVPATAFNVSARCIRESGFAEKLLAKIRDYNISPSFLQIEITESALLESTSTVVGNISVLHQAGIRISIDDFGTGYSSLSYLKRLPLHELKIDRNFVAGLGQNREDEAIVTAILGMAGSLGLMTVAEGVENQQQNQWLINNGCNLAQGYYYSFPLKASELERRIVPHASS